MFVGISLVSSRLSLFDLLGRVYRKEEEKKLHRFGCVVANCRTNIGELRKVEPWICRMLKLTVCVGLEKCAK